MTVSISTTTQLPESISPCSNVRRTCYSLMNDDASFEHDKSGNARSVIINHSALDDLGSKIAQSILSHPDKELKGQDDCKESPPIESYIQNLSFASWDEEQWHYTAKGYIRSHVPDHDVEKQRFERVALYIMVMDTINFCFWPVADTEELTRSSSYKKNLLEYEHLAQALKKMAEADDDILISSNNTNISPDKSSTGSLSVINNGDGYTKAEDSYSFAPQNLVNLTVESFLDKIMPLLPVPDEKQKDCIYCIPNVSERVRLLIEMAQGLLTFYDGSATKFIASAKRSSDVLVYNILQNFPGFRDATVDPKCGRWVAFYKRAQILVADLWAALGSESGDEKYGMDLCNFTDMSKITTFADYRVPQLLRSMKVLEYSPTLANKVDSGDELLASSMDELYIRAATVVAVDLLVENVRLKLPNKLNQGINAVKMDWYLWNIGEKLDRQNCLGNHHLVRTIFY